MQVFNDNTKRSFSPTEKQRKILEVPIAKIKKCMGRPGLSGGSSSSGEPEAYALFGWLGDLWCETLGGCGPDICDGYECSCGFTAQEYGNRICKRKYGHNRPYWNGTCECEGNMCSAQCTKYKPSSTGAIPEKLEEGP